ncbi:MAG: hypothetical protein AB7T19_14735 [Planctomycetota bacterium]
MKFGWDIGAGGVRSDSIGIRASGAPARFGVAGFDHEVSEHSGDGLPDLVMGA